MLCASAYESQLDTPNHGNPSILVGHTRGVAVVISVDVVCCAVSSVVAPICLEVSIAVVTFGCLDVSVVPVSWLNAVNFSHTVLVHT